MKKSYLQIILTLKNWKKEIKIQNIGLTAALNSRKEVLAGLKKKGNINSEKITDI